MAHTKKKTSWDTFLNKHIGTPVISLTDLLSCVSEGQLATAIESKGIYTWDRFNRLVHVFVDSDDVKRALDLLAKRVEWRNSNSDDFDPAEPDQYNPYDMFGWPPNEFPNFEAVLDNSSKEKTLNLSNRTIPEERQKTTYLNIIGALINLMLEKTPGGQHYSKFKTQNDIITKLILLNKSKSGISKRTLEKLFSQGKNSLSVE